MSDHIVLNGRMVGEQRIGKDLEESWPNQGTILSSAWRKTMKHPNQNNQLPGRETN